MRSLAVLCVLAGLFGSSRPAGAQEPPPPIPRFVIDLHAVLPTFPDDPNLALSRALNQAELPGVGLGADVAVHVYPFTWRQVTFGVGGRLTTARAHRDPVAAGQLRPVTERFTYLGPQVSLNFGTGTGWSYLSGGIATSVWSLVPDCPGADASPRCLLNGSGPLPSDEERLKTLDYGGGARWFAKAHVAFSFDVRFYAIGPGSPGGALPSGPRTTLLVIGAGISLK